MQRLAPQPPSEPGTRRRPGVLPAPDDLRSVAPDLVRDLQARDIAVWVLDADGRVLAHGPSTPDGPRPEGRLMGTLRTRVASRVSGTLVYRVANDRGSWQVVVVPLVRDDQVAGALVLASPFSTAELLLDRLRFWLLVGALAVVLLGTVFGLVLARALATPLERMAQTAAQIAAGDLDRRVGLPPGRNEVYATASAFDRMVDRLQALLAAQRRFVADASHELKTPLTAIGGMVEMLRLGADRADPNARQRMLAAVEREVDRMGRLVRDLLTLSRIDESFALDRRPLALAEILRQAVNMASQAHPDHPFELDVAGPLPTAGDPDLLERVFLNLLDNAAKYSDPGLPVQVRGRPEAGRLVVTVQDHGQGIPAADLPHIFDRFYRADPSRTRQTGGSGLGMAIVRAAVERHAGTVSIASQVGQGTTVTVELPAAPAAAPSNGAVERLPDPPPASRSETLAPKVAGGAPPR